MLNDQHTQYDYKYGHKATVVIFRPSQLQDA